MYCEYCGWQEKVEYEFIDNGIIRPYIANNSCECEEKLEKIEDVLKTLDCCKEDCEHNYNLIEHKLLLILIDNLLNLNMEVDKLYTKYKEDSYKERITFIADDMYSKIENEQMDLIKINSLDYLNSLTKILKSKTLDFRFRNIDSKKIILNIG